MLYILYDVRNSEDDFEQIFVPQYLCNPKKRKLGVRCGFLNDISRPMACSLSLAPPFPLDFISCLDFPCSAQPYDSSLAHLLSLSFPPRQSMGCRRLPVSHWWRLKQFQTESDGRGFSAYTPNFAQRDELEAWQLTFPPALVDLNSVDLFPVPRMSRPS
jgi:hypothetical protein